MRAIDADELLTAFPVDDEPTLTKSCVRMTIQHMPTIEPERIRGKWVNYGEGECCDQCGRYPYDDGEFHILGWRSNFCPHCGADMRGEELDETD